MFKKNIEAMSKKFAVKIVQLYEFLYSNETTPDLAKQLLRCGTGVGANVASHESLENNISFTELNAAIKNCGETLYWLELLYETDHIDKKTYNSFSGECEELMKALQSTVKNGE